MQSQIRGFALIVVVSFVLTASIPAVHAQTYTVLHNFRGTYGDSRVPSTSSVIAQGRDGNMYSTTPDGGIDSLVFRITPAGAERELPFHFFPAEFPADSGLTFATDGNFWGTTEGYQFWGLPGIIFKMNAAGNVVEYNTFGGTDEVNGNTATAPPVQGRDGNFYGTTSAGGNIQLCAYGNGGCGVIYRFTALGQYKVLHTFDQEDGANPYGALVLGGEGNFYGTTQLGGAADAGVVFKITPSSGRYSILYTFCSQANCADGANPYDALVKGADGNFYGTTQNGGSGILPDGVVFKLTPAGQYTVLYNFCSQSNCTDGANPLAGLVQATDGNFYGTTVSGGASNFGTIYQISPDGHYTVLHSFDNSDGANPATTPVQNTNGILYGTTAAGGQSFFYCGPGCGVFYSVDMGLSPFVTLVNWYASVGQPVTILGQGLNATTQVSFNGVPATFTLKADTYLTTTVPTGAADGFVTVSTPSGTLTSNKVFRVKP